MVRRHGKSFVAIVATYDLQACQALEDHNDACEIAEAIKNGELDEPGMPWEEVRKDLGL